MKLRDSLSSELLFALENGLILTNLNYNREFTSSDTFKNIIYSNSEMANSELYQYLGSTFIENYTDGQGDMTNIIFLCKPNVELNPDMITVTTQSGGKNLTQSKLNGTWNYMYISTVYKFDFITQQKVVNSGRHGWNMIDYQLWNSFYPDPETKNASISTTQTDWAFFKYYANPTWQPTNNDIDVAINNNQNFSMGFDIYATSSNIYTITNTLQQGCVNNSSQTVVLENNRYYAEITTIGNYWFPYSSSVSVTMGGTDVAITKNSGTKYTIDIAQVTGDIVINGTCEHPKINLFNNNKIVKEIRQLIDNNTYAYHNINNADLTETKGVEQLRLTTTGTPIDNIFPLMANNRWLGILLKEGYRFNDVYFDTSSAVYPIACVVKTGTSVTRSVPYWYDYDNNTLTQYGIIVDGVRKMNFMALYTYTTAENREKPTADDVRNPLNWAIGYRIRLGSSSSYIPEINYIQDKLLKDEVWEWGINDFVLTDTPPTPTYTVTNNLTNCSNSNSDISVDENDSYNGIISPTTGYQMSSITVTMGGTDITSSVVTTVNGTYVINISSVTGNLVITALAITIPITYTITNNLTNCSNSNTSTSINENDSYNGTISANSGYELSSITVTMGGTDITNSVVTTVNNTYVINIAYATSNIIITANATALPNVYTITNNLTNCSNNNASTSITENDTYSATVTANTNYVFNVGNVSVYVGSTQIQPSFSSDYKSFTINTVATGNIVITASATIEQYTVTKNISGCNATFSPDVNTLNYGDNYSGTFTSTQGYVFNSGDIVVTMNGVNVPITFNSSNTQGTFNITSVTGNINIVATQSAQGINVTITGNNIKQLMTITNGVREYVNLTSPYVLNYTNTITSTSTLSVKITSVATDYDYENGYEILGENVSCTVNGNYADFTLSKDLTIPYNNVFNFTLTGQPISGGISINVNATKYSEHIPDYSFGMCNVYNPNIETLDDLSHLLRPVGTTVDYSSRIYKLYRTYVNIPIKATQQTIKLGDYDSALLSNVVATNPIVVNCGSVTLNEVFENVIDYSSFTKLEIFLPFIGIEELDIDVIRNKEVTLVYKFNVLTGKCIALLYINHNIIYQFTGSICDEIPYSSNSVIVQQGDNQLPITMSTNYPYYIITQNIGKAPYDIDGKPTYDKILLTNKTGLVIVNTIDLITNATNEEQEEIKMLLSRGVIIKELPTSAPIETVDSE